MMLNKVSTIHELIKLSNDEDIKILLNSSPGDYFSNHWHNELEIVFLISGELTITIQNQPYKLSPNNFILINSSIIHSTKSINGNVALVLQIPHKFIKKYLSNADNIMFNLPFEANNIYVNNNINKINDILKSMYSILKCNTASYKLKFNALLFELLYLLYDNFKIELPENKFLKQNKNLFSLEPILFYVEENYTSPITIAEISKIAGFQEKYFCRFFKKNMGMTFLQYLCELRLSHIYHDLITTTLPINQIIEIHGFTNYKLFRKTFKERFNKTPREIRKLHKNQS